MSDNRWFGFDWLRAGFIAAVVGMHLNFANLQGEGGFRPMDVVQADLLCLAVPGFLLVSYFLQIRARESGRAFARRMLRFGALYVFWVGLWLMWTWRGSESLPGGILRFSELVLRGGGWAFYFFAVLILLCPLARWAGTMKLRTAGVVSGVFLGLNLAALAVMAGEGYVWTHMQTYWWPANFLAVPFVARLLDACAEGGLPWGGLVTGAAVVFVTGAAVEWCLHAPPALAGPDRALLPEYLRPAPIAGASLLVALAMRVRRPPPAWIMFLARNSLGIFCLHVFVLRGVVTFIGSVTRTTFPVTPVIAWPLILFGMAGASELFRRILREKLI